MNAATQKLEPPEPSTDVKTDCCVFSKPLLWDEETNELYG